MQQTCMGARSLLLMGRMGSEAGSLGKDAGRPCRLPEADAAAVAFCKQYRPAIEWAINAACVPHRHRADVRQDVALRLLKRFRKHGPLEEGSHASFAITVARHACLDHFRRNRQERPATDPAIYDRVADDARLPDELVERADGHARLHLAIASLTPLRRYVVRQVLAGRSLVEVAAELERSHGSVKVLHHRAVTDLRKALKCR